MSVKFRNPKTGAVFNGDGSDFCGRYQEEGCESCPIKNKIESQYGSKSYFKECDEWVNEHPEEAARLMGYELVQDEEKGCHNCGVKDGRVCSRCTAISKRKGQAEAPSMWVPDGKAVLKKKPPIGLMPESIWKEQRFNDICHAIGRYVFAGIDPLPEWIDEGRRLMKELEVETDEAD